MNFDNLLETALGFFHQYSILVAVIAVILLFVAYKNLKATFKLALLLLFIAAFLYAISLFGDVFSTGSKNADQMINKTRNMIE